METHYQTDLNKAFLIIEGEEYQEEDYRIQVLRDNYISGLINMEVRYIDNAQKYYYDISGKTAVKQLFERRRPGFEEIKNLIESLLCVMRTLKQYMISSESLLLDEETIFYEKGKYWFCFCPAEKTELSQRLHKLTEFLVREVDYREEKGVHLAYVMHKATMEDNYSLEQIMEEFKQEILLEDEEEEEPIVTYQSSIPPQEESMVAEKKDWWESVKRLIEKTRMRL